MNRRERSGIVFYEFENLSACRELRHGIFTRLGGISEGEWSSLNVSKAVGDQEEAVEENRRRMVGALGFGPNDLITAGQIHGTQLGVASTTGTQQLGSSRIPDTDGLLVVEQGLCLAMTFADCVPLILYDPVQRVGGLVHAGWRGTVGGIGPEAVRMMGLRFGSRPDDVLVGIGPSIGPCCYEVGNDVLSRVEQALGNVAGVVRTRENRPYLDLWEANRKLLIGAGVLSEHIETARMCTSCRTDEFFSHRRERGRTGRFGAAVGLMDVPQTLYA